MWTAVGQYKEWKNDGKPTQSGKPNFKKVGYAIDILKVVLPRIDPSDNISKYNSGTKSLDRLLKMTGWEAEIEKVVEKRLLRRAV